MFATVTTAPPDAILGLNEAFREDRHPEKMNLGVGVFQDENGVTPILSCVQTAERRLTEQQTSKSYLPIDGYAPYDRLVAQLMLGANHPVVTDQRIVTVQTPGGTGALRVAADFLHSHFAQTRVWLSRPTWANHAPLFNAAGLQTAEYRYLDADTYELQFEAMMSDVDQMSPGDVILVHGCCHNPSGVDPSPAQWVELSERIAAKRLLPIVDFAYQGFGNGLEEDASGLLQIVNRSEDALICSSFSKNFGLYRERVGALSAVAPNGAAAQAVLSQLKRSIRTNYSNPPFHGAAIVATVLQDDQLRDQWHVELAAMRNRINDMRNQLVAGLAAENLDRDFSCFAKQRGMFSFSGLNPQQVQRLRDEYSIYIVGSGRINVAGITPRGLPRLCAAIANVLR